MCDKCNDPAAAEAARADKNLEQIREYAWNWFSYHAGQRTNMFNYSLAAAAILAAGYGAALDKSPLVAAVIGFVGALVSLFFVFLDRRNHQLVEYGENVLKAVEAMLFAAAERADSPLKQHGMPIGILRVDTPDEFFKDVWAGKHRIYLRLVEWLLLLAFLAGGFAALCAPQLFAPANPDAAAAIREVAAGVRAAAENLEVIGDKLTGTDANAQGQAPPP
jgi:hypothetical protein